MSQTRQIPEGCEQSGRDRNGGLPQLLMLLGAVLLGEAFILFVSANWRAIPNMAKLAMVFAGVLVAYGLGWRMRFGLSPRPGPASALFLKGATAYGVGIFLIGQIYNFHAEWRAGILYWFLGTLPLAYAICSRPLLWLSLGTLYLWLLARFVPWEADNSILLLQILGTLLALVAVPHWHPLKLPGFAKIYFGLGVGTALYCGVTMAAMHLFSEPPHWDLDRDFVTYFATFGTLFLLLWITLILTRKSLLDRARWLLVLLLPVSLLPCIYPIIRHRWEAAALPEGVFLVCLLLLLFGECLGLFLFSQAMQIRTFTKIALPFFLSMAVMLYSTEYWSYLFRSGFFFVGGVLLLAWGYSIDRRRQRVVPHSNSGGMS